MVKRAETSIPVTKFKAMCLEVIDRVSKGKSARVVLTKRGKPVAALVPCGTKPQRLWGAMRGTVMVAEGVDLAAPTGEVWDAERDA